MPEIRLGSSESMKNINLGSKEIQAVKKGTVVVWLNNLPPQIQLTSPQVVGVYGDENFPIDVVAGANTTVTFQARDIDPGDTIVSYAVDGPTDFTPIPTTPITPPGNPVTGLTFTIPGSLFPTFGIPTTDNVFTITITDQRGAEGEYTVTVANVSVVGPTAKVESSFPSVKAYSPASYTRSAKFSMTQSPSAIQNHYTPEYSDDGGVTWKTYPGYPVELYATTTCGVVTRRYFHTRSVSNIYPTSPGTTAKSVFVVSAPDIVIQGGYSGLPGGLSMYQTSELRISADCSKNTRQWETRGSEKYGQHRTVLPTSTHYTKYFWAHNPSATVSIGSDQGTLYYNRDTITVRVGKYYFIPPIPTPPSSPPPLTFTGISYGTATLSYQDESFNIPVGTPSITCAPITINISAVYQSISYIGGNIGPFNGSPAQQNFNGFSNSVSFDTSGWSPGTYNYTLAAVWGFTSNGVNIQGVNRAGEITVTVT